VWANIAQAGHLTIFIAEQHKIPAQHPHPDWLIPDITA
jgi:hypothetical protein